MNEVEYLPERAARAERLARSILDTVTVERLQAFAAEWPHAGENPNNPGWRPPDLLVQDAEDGDAGSAPRTSNCD